MLLSTVKYRSQVIELYERSCRNPIMEVTAQSIATTTQRSSPSGVNGFTIAAIVISVASALSLILCISACVYFSPKSRKATQDGQIQSLDQAPHESPTYPDAAVCQTCQQFIKPGPSVYPPATASSEKPEPGGSGVCNNALPLTCQRVLDVGRDIELPLLPGPTISEHNHRPAELQG